MKINKEEQYEFDDVLLSPIPSSVNSRSDVDISVDVLGKFKLKFPAIASPMKSVVNAEFCKLFAELGGIGILPKYQESKNAWYLEAEKISEAKLFGLAIGLNDSTYIDFLKFKPNILCVDLANGGIDALVDFCSRLRKIIDEKSPDTLLMTGNVTSFVNTERLYKAGVNMVRVGVGGSIVCTTRNVTGVGVPQLSAIDDCSKSNAFIVSDGGTKSSGDMVKAFVAGADLVMLGSLLSYTYESPAKDKVYGMAGRTLQEEMGFKEIKSIEGRDVPIEKKWSLKQFVSDYTWGIRSAGTYLNAKNIEEMRNNGEFVKVGNGSIKKLD
jgi:IMP dehydrogenase